MLIFTLVMTLNLIFFVLIYYVLYVQKIDHDSLFSCEEYDLFLSDPVRWSKTYDIVKLFKQHAHRNEKEIITVANLYTEHFHDDIAAMYKICTPAGRKLFSPEIQLVMI